MLEELVKTLGLSFQSQVLLLSQLQVLQLSYSILFLLQLDFLQVSLFIQVFITIFPPQEVFPPLFIKFQLKA